MLRYDGTFFGLKDITTKDGRVIHQVTIITQDTKSFMISDDFLPALRQFARGSDLSLLVSEQNINGKVFREVIEVR